MAAPISRAFHRRAVAAAAARWSVALRGRGPAPFASAAAAATATEEIRSFGRACRGTGGTWAATTSSTTSAAAFAAAAAAAAAAASVAASWSGSGPVACASAKTRRVPLGKVEEFEDGSMREVPVGEEGSKAAVLVHRHAGAFYVTSPACSHYGAPLKKGVSSAGGRGGAPTVSCPLHDATFDLVTGKVVRGPSIDGIATYKSEVAGGTLYAEIPEAIFAGSKHERVMKAMAKPDRKDGRVFALVGGGPASLAAAETLRQEGFTGRVVMLTKEAHFPYDRVRLSKTPDVSVDALTLRPPEFFDKYGIEVLREAVVTKLDSKGQTVHYTAADGTEASLKYDSVLVASGGTPRKLFCPGSSLKGVHTLRTPEDAAEISKYAKKGQKVIVVGGSFIGMEIASALKKKGCDVSVIAMETVPFERVLGKKVGASFARLLQKEGVQWYGTAQVRLFRGNDAVNGVELEDGEVLPADAVVIGAGVLPNTRFVEGVSLDKNGAICVGPLLNAEAVPNLYAAGDVCTYPSMRTGTRVRIEHWDVATQQGRVAAKNMLGQYVPFTTTPFFWSGLFGKNLRFVGHAPDVLDRVIIEGDVAGMEFISYYTEDDEIRAVATLNKDPVAVACAELMRRGQMPKASELLIGTVNAEVILKRLRDLSVKAVSGRCACIVVRCGDEPTCGENGVGGRVSVEQLRRGLARVGLPDPSGEALSRMLEAVVESKESSIRLPEFETILSRLTLAQIVTFLEADGGAVGAAAAAALHAAQHPGTSSSSAGGGAAEPGDGPGVSGADGGGAGGGGGRGPSAAAPRAKMTVVDYNVRVPPEQRVYTAGGRSDAQLRRFFFGHRAAPTALGEPQLIRWVHLQGFDLNLLLGLTVKYNLHPLAVEDTIEQAPSKADRYGDHYFTTIEGLCLAKPANECESVHVTGYHVAVFCAGPPLLDTVITFAQEDFSFAEDWPS
eukprot:CAMPEP_0115647620 /NCGR_PEP_ID=MMETSP0272-20121206/39546_1 /TAXON_ID=71861 /ORGANISM="Scrippsiella trochoidea, Strain CCMP3099" /LENGTH=950 /DNA_ID=CAMNT_0003085197 /DNA_START=1 /DNA_END=2848 /DNA_ORIENTATION=-